MPQKSILIITGGQYHDFPAMAAFLKELLTRHGFQPDTTEDRDALLSLPDSNYAAIVVCTQGGTLTDAQEAGLLKFVKSGRGFVGLHGASASWKENAGYIDMLGCQFIKHGPEVEFSIEPTGVRHTIVRHIPTFQADTELYQLAVKAGDFTTLLHASWQGKFEPVAYIRPYGAGRVFYFSIGHDVGDMQDTIWQTVLLRGLRWSMGFTERPGLKVGVIGYGGAFNMGRTHLTEMQNAGFIPVAACDIDPARAKAAEREFPDIRSYTSINEMLAHTDAQLLTVILPHNAHAKVAVDVLNSGRHCVVEKPMATSSDEVHAMIAAAESNRLMLSVYHNRRWDGDFLAMEDIIRHRKLLGDIFKIETGMSCFASPGSWWRSSKTISGGLHYDWGAHLIFWALLLMDAPIESVTATRQKRLWHHVTNDDQVDACIRFKNGGTLDFEISTIASVPRPRWRILGTRGGILDYWDDTCFQLAVHQHGIASEPQRVKYPPSQGYRYYENIADHLGLDDPLEITAEKAGRVVHVLHAIDKAAQSGKAESVCGEV
ncbi:MAG: ThuA domain-containing protein [Phycisphaerae bacterium]